MTVFARFFVRLWLWSGAYHVWSRLYRWAKERKWRGVELPSYETLQELEADLAEMRWTQDGIRRWFDTISTPKAAWGRHKAGGSAGDCDDISVYAADRIADMAERGELAEHGILDGGAVGLLTCVWLNRGKAAGHNVCAFWYVDRRDGERRWAHVSNWFDGAVQHGYGMIDEVFRSVCAGGIGEPLAWTWADPGSLKVRRRG
jgi:hypothetical protein